MEKSIFDLAVDQLIDDVKVIKGEVREMFKGTKPFRQVKVTPLDAVTEYLPLDEDVKMQLRQYPEWAEKEQKILKYMESKRNGN